MKYYKAQHNNYSKNIEVVEIEKESENSVWIKNTCLRKRTDYNNYFPTYEAAKNWLIEKATEDIRKHEERLTTANNLRSKYLQL